MTQLQQEPSATRSEPLRRILLRQAAMQLQSGMRPSAPRGRRLNGPKRRLLSSTYAPAQAAINAASFLAAVWVPDGALANSSHIMTMWQHVAELRMLAET